MKMMKDCYCDCPKPSFIWRWPSSSSSGLHGDRRLRGISLCSELQFNVTHVHKECTGQRPDLEKCPSALVALWAYCSKSRSRLRGIGDVYIYAEIVLLEIWEECLPGWRISLQMLHYYHGKSRPDLWSQICFTVHWAKMSGNFKTRTKTLWDFRRRPREWPCSAYCDAEKVIRRVSSFPASSYKAKLCQSALQDVSHMGQTVPKY